MTTFLQGKNDARKLNTRSMSAKEFNLNEEHRKMTEKLDLHDYDIVRVPKPSVGEEERRA